METITIVFNIDVPDDEISKILEDIEDYIHEHHSAEINSTDRTK